MNLKIRKNVVLAPFTAFKIGGKAKYFAEVKTSEELISAICWADKKAVPFKIFAGGSNLLISDKKLAGLFIRFCGGKIRKVGEKSFLVDAGAKLETVVKKSLSGGLKGLESLSGIPGTVGGAVIGNAGAYGHSIAETIKKVEIFDCGRRRWLEKNDCEFSYRESVFKKKPYLILRVVLRFKKGNKTELQKISRDILKIRRKKYNPEMNCPGSFFKNVFVKDIPKTKLKFIDKSKIIGNKIPAGCLLEQVGAKGMRIGKIKVADFHGNLIMNLGGGRAEDVEKLAGILKRKVKKKFGIKLEEEVRRL